jgi:DNA repair protein RadC
MKLTRSQKEKVRAALAVMDEAQDYSPVMGAVVNASDAARLARMCVAQHDASREHFGVMMLDSQHRVRSAQVLFHGTLDAATVHPREVVRAAILADAAAVILFHNHPSGRPEPSRADEALTQRLNNALMIAAEIRVLDHIIVTADASVSFAERGLL